MIQIPNLPDFGDPELDSFLKNFINNAIKDKILEIITLDEESHEPEGALCLFPVSFPEENVDEAVKTLKAIYSLIISDKEWVPTLLMEYVIASVIEAGIDDFNDLEEYRGDSEELSELWERHKGEDKYVNFPFSAKLQKKLFDAYLKTAKEHGDFDGEWDKEYAKDIVDNLWHFSKFWYDWCFWDMDYALLDKMEIGELRHSPVNGMMGILSENANDDEYYLPEDWEKSKDFRFLHEVKG